MIDLGFENIPNNLDKLDRNNGLIDINNHADESLLCGNVSDNYECGPWFEDFRAIPDYEIEPFFNTCNLIIAAENGKNPLDLTIKEILLQKDKYPRNQYL